MNDYMSSPVSSSSSSSSSSSNDSVDEKYRYPQPTAPTCHINGGGVASVVLSCCAPELRPSPTNNDGGTVRGGNVWSEKEYGRREHGGRPTEEMRRYPALGCGPPQAAKKPFASNPLLDRDDSLVQEGSLLSLVASVESRRSYDEPPPATPQHSRQQREERRAPKPFESSPLLTRDDSLVQGGSLLSLIASQDETDHQRQQHAVPSTPLVSYARFDSRFRGTHSGDVSSVQPPPPPPSPAMELSMAKRQASQMMGKSCMRRDPSHGSLSRELSRGSSLFPKVHSVASNGGVAKSKDSSPSTLRPAEENGSFSHDRVSVYRCLGRMYPPIWTEDDNIHSELKATYRHPRLFADDPSDGIGNARGTVWWYRIGRRMDTTLPHVFDSHWQELETQRESGVDNDASANAASDDAGRMIATEACGPDAIVDLCSNNTPPRICRRRQRQPHDASDGVGGYSEISPVNAWSEPSASTTKIRGRTYKEDGVKVESDTAIFACLGVDSFVSGDGAGDNSNTAHYLERWRRVCEEVGLDKTPFLLVINFVVPWGNFQSYSFRPDADDGPFSSSFYGRPSEKAWRAFVEGNAEYRNKCLKLIPRVVAGPWVVKKMVGSTPALIGTKLPVSYRGSIRENFLEITMDVTKGPAFGNTVANTVVGKADLVTVDLGFVIEGQEDDGTLPEQMLSLIRLHHLEMKRACTVGRWRDEVERRQMDRR